MRLSILGLVTNNPQTTELLNVIPPGQGNALPWTPWKIRTIVISDVGSWQSAWFRITPGLRLFMGSQDLLVIDWQPFASGGV